MSAHWPVTISTLGVYRTTPTTRENGVGSIRRCPHVGYNVLHWVTFIWWFYNFNWSTTKAKKDIRMSVYIHLSIYIFLNRSKYNISYTLNTFFIISFNTWFTNPVFSTYIVHLVYEYIYARFFRVSICSWFHFLLDWILWFLKQVLVDAVVQEKPLNDLWKIVQVNFRGIF